MLSSRQMANSQSKASTSVPANNRSIRQSLDQSLHPTVLAVLSRFYMISTLNSAAKLAPASENWSSTTQNAKTLTALARTIFEPGELFEESQRDVTGRAVTLFCDDQVRFADFFLLRVFVGLVVFRSYQEPDQ